MKPLTLLLPLAVILILNNSANCLPTSLRQLLASDNNNHEATQMAPEITTSTESQPQLEQQSEECETNDDDDDNDDGDDEFSNQNQTQLPDNQQQQFNGSRDVFISVKTTAKFHSKRLDLIIATWFQKAPQNSHFFTDIDDDLYKTRLNGRLHNTHCSSSHSRRALACKMSKEFAYYATINASWFCHFDDDNYVNVNRLYAILSKLDSNEKHYIGKTSIRGPLELDSTSNKFWFATGGAGFCLSRALAAQMTPLVLDGRFMEISEKLHLPDDVAVGYIIETELKTKLRVVDAFHSHLEPMSLLPVADLPAQISFSYSQYGNALNVLDLNSPQQVDPKLDKTKFFALHCHLFAADCEQSIRRFKALKAANKRRNIHHNNNNKKQPFTT